MILRARGVLPVSQPFIEDGAVAVEGDLITAIGRWSDLKRDHCGDALDLGAVMLMPGLVNAHCHLDYTDMGGMLPRARAFPDWIKALVALKASWGYSEYAASWIHGASMLVRNGVTTVADIEAVPELLPETWSATPLRVISFLELINVRSWHSAGQMVHDAEAKLESLPDGTNRAGLSPHAPFTVSPDLLQRAAAMARRHAWPISTHVAESAEEFDMFMHRRGPLFEWLSPQRDTSACGSTSPIRFLARQGLLGPDFLAVHVNYLAEGDSGLLAQHRSSVVHCPLSHAFLRHQRFPLEDFLDDGVNICLGTDSLASNEPPHRKPLELDLFAEMRALARSHPELSAEQIVRMATVNGAQALGRAHLIGDLKPGGQADLIAVPFHGRIGNPWELAISHEGPVAASMIRGKWAIAPTPMRPQRRSRKGRVVADGPTPAQGTP